MLELWTSLEASMRDDASILIEKEGHYEWGDDGNEHIVRADVTIENSFDLYAAVANSMVDHLCDLFEDGTSGDYGEFWFVALCHGEAHGYCIRPSDVDDLNDDGEVYIFPLGKEWDDDLKEALDRYYGEEE